MSRSPPGRRPTTPGARRRGRSAAPPRRRLRGRRGVGLEADAAQGLAGHGDRGVVDRHVAPEGGDDAVDDEPVVGAAEHERTHPRGGPRRGIRDALVDGRGGPRTRWPRRGRAPRRDTSRRRRRRRRRGHGGSRSTSSQRSPRRRPARRPRRPGRIAGTVPMTGTSGSSSARRAPRPCTEAVLHATTMAAGVVREGGARRGEDEPLHLVRGARAVGHVVRVERQHEPEVGAQRRGGRRRSRGARARCRRRQFASSTLDVSGDSVACGRTVSGTPRSVHRRVVREVRDVREAVALAPEHTLARGPRGRAVKASRTSASTTYQSPRSTSFSSWPASQPE